MWNYARTFFSEASAERFALELKMAGAVDVVIWSGRDAFNQTQWTVRWNLKEED